MKKNFNIIRQIRLQLKTGFLKKEPPEYTFLRRYPPMLRDRAPAFHNTSLRKIPYMQLYEKAVQKNPLYEDEKVYGGYWQQEPQALTLAKKQHEFMTQGMSEEDAYLKAVDFVSDLESKSYEELKELLDLIKAKEARLPFATDGKLVSEISAWKAKLAKVNYDDLKLAEKGELDYFIQTRILKWNEVERERRMKDILFAFEFEKLREQLFPDAKSLESEERRSNRTEVKNSFYASNSIRHPEQLRTSEPFLYEDYVAYFNKAKQTPQLSQWALKDREDFSKWIINALAVQHILDKSTTGEVQSYLKELRSLFFPMVAGTHNHHLAQKLTLPSVDELKSMLYDNEVGYKRDAEGKLFIRRFYRLPMLLFPQQTFQVSICKDVDRFKQVLSSDEALMAEMQSCGLLPDGAPTTNTLFGQVKSELAQLARKHPLIDGGKKGKGVAGADDDSSSDSDSSSSDDSSSDGEGEEDDEESAEFLLRVPEVFDDATGKLRASPGPFSPNVNPESWKKLVHKYAKRPTNTLESEREAYYFTRTKGQGLQVEDCRSEADLLMVQRQRLDKDMITRARLAIHYEEKESVRRARDWKRRGVWMNNSAVSDFSLPSPELDVR